MKEYSLYNEIVSGEKATSNNVEKHNGIYGEITANGVVGNSGVGDKEGSWNTSNSGDKENSWNTNNSGNNGNSWNAGNIENGVVNNKNLPAKIGLWGKVKAFLFQEIDLNAEIVLELSPKEKKVLTEVHDFLFQEVKFPELHDFLFQEVTIFGKKGNKK